MFTRIVKNVSRNNQASISKMQLLLVIIILIQNETLQLEYSLTKFAIFSHFTHGKLTTLGNWVVNFPCVMQNDSEKRQTSRGYIIHILQ